MVEEVQDKIVDLLTTYLESELSGLESPSGGVALTLAVPAEYLINFDPNSTILDASYPKCLILAARTTHDDELSTGYRVVNWHELAVVVLIIDQDIEKLQRKRSRYAEAIRSVLKTYQQTAPLQMVRNFRFVYDRTLRDESLSAYLGSVWILLEARERETI